MSKKKKIGVFIDWYLPGYKAGGPIRSCANLIQHLNPYFDFYVITRNTDYTEKKPYEGIPSNEWITLDDGTKVYYFSEGHLTRRKLSELIKEKQFDTVYINGIYSFFFSILPLEIARQQKLPKIIVATRGMLAPSAIKVKATKKRLFLALGRITGRYRKIIFHATNEQEAKDIRRRLGRRKEIIIAPNLPKKYGQLKYVEKEKKVRELKLVSVARIAPEKNLKYALEVLQKVKSNITFHAYGPIYDEKYWEECKSVRLPKNITFEHKGSIDNEKLQEKLKDYHFLFLPTRGENFGHIILEAFAAGLPAILSDQTPWKGLRAKSVGVDLPLNNSNEFAEFIDKAANFTQEEYNTTSKAAINYGKAFIENPELIKQSKKLFE